MKRFTIGLAICLFVLLSAFPMKVNAETTTPPYNLIINGLPTGISSQSIDKCFYVPIKATCLAFGVNEKDIVWDGINKTITVKKDYTVFVATINSNVLILNNKPITMKHGTIIFNNTSLIPVGYFENIFKHKLSIDTKNNVLTLTYNPEVKEFMELNSEFKLVVSQIDKLLQQNQITPNEIETTKTQIINLEHKLQLWGELYKYTSMKNLYYKTFRNGISACFYKMCINDPKFNLIQESNKKEYEKYLRDYNNNKNEITAEIIRLQKLDYI